MIDQNQPQVLPMPGQTSIAGVGNQPYRPGFSAEQQYAVGIGPMRFMAGGTQPLMSLNTVVQSPRNDTRAGIGSLPGNNMGFLDRIREFLRSARGAPTVAQSAVTNRDPEYNPHKVDVKDWIQKTPEDREAALRRAGATGSVINNNLPPVMQAVTQIWGKGSLKGIDQALADNPTAVAQIASKYQKEYADLLRRYPNLSGEANSPTRSLLKDLRSRIENDIAAVATPTFDARDAQIKADVDKAALVSRGGSLYRRRQKEQQGGSSEG